MIGISYPARLFDLIEFRSFRQPFEGERMRSGIERFRRSFAKVDRTAVEHDHDGLSCRPSAENELLRRLVAVPSLANRQLKDQAGRDI